MSRTVPGTQQAPYKYLLTLLAIAAQKNRLIWASIFGKSIPLSKIHMEIMRIAMLQSRPHKWCGDDKSLLDYWAGAQLPPGGECLCVLQIS